MRTFTYYCRERERAQYFGFVCVQWSAVMNLKFIGQKRMQAVQKHLAKINFYNTYEYLHTWIDNCNIYIDYMINILLCKNSQVRSLPVQDNNKAYTNYPLHLILRPINALFFRHIFAQLFKSNAQICIQAQARMQAQFVFTVHVSVNAQHKLLELRYLWFQGCSTVKSAWADRYILDVLFRHTDRYDMADA